MHEINKVNYHPIGADESQRMVYETVLTNEQTGEEDTVHIEVSGFTYPAAAVRAVLDFAEGLTELYLKGGVANPPNSVDRELRQLLEVDGD
ncbi:hypothetical protein MINTM005_13020 [Mycobacterium intracellulare]|uniref:hypothetical protein n=1 Tax=Mycobacterium intracellulare TaxID=1767 RepID=UPI001927396B|nr:hypothetical protein [Mycobacterium intracellulare]BCO56058.1 hypothetical protein MINTM005_13020 [Mycobacterium intracellulare]